MKRRCIEGVWFEDFGKWRYGRGNLGFYHHYTRIPDVDKVNKTHGKLIRPLIRDLEWHYSYNMLVARGFSGFDEDEKYTSDWRVFNAKKTKGLPSDNELCLYKPNGTFKEFIEPYENAFRLHDKPVGKPLYNNDAKNFIILGSRSGGKALLHGSIVYTDNGIKKIEDCKKGDQVFGADGKLTTITDVFPQGTVPIYEITFRSGRKVKCCGDHLWEVKAWGRKAKVVSTKEMLKDYVSKRKVTDRNKKGLEYKYRVKNNQLVNYSTKDFEIDPYLIGILLGDGYVKKQPNYSKQRVVSFTTANADLQHYLDNIILPEKCYYRKQLKTGTDNYTVTITTDNKTGREQVKNGNHLFIKLKKLGLNKRSYEKSIPEEYFYGDKEQRFRLLQGIMDTDGYTEKKGKNRVSIGFASSSKQLAQDVVRLCRSLGIPCHEPKFKPNEFKGSWRFILYTDNPNVFSLPRKKDRITKRVSNSAISRVKDDIICNIEKVQDGEATCIMVDNQDKCFLTDNYVVTHNSIYSINAEVFYDITFDGAKVYNEEVIKNPNQILINVGAGIKGKSAKTLAFMKISSNFLKTNPEAGTWGKLGDDDWEPCPFYKEMTGSFDTDDERGWTNRFSVKAGNGWEERGTGSTVYHVSYSANKRTGAESGAGGRRSLIMYEEIGLFEDLLNAWGSDEAVVSVDGVQFAPRIGIGTSGNIHTIKAAQKIFTHPDDYNCIAYKGKNEDKHCFFLPAYIVDKRFKDKNGNTDVEAAKKYYDDKLAEKLQTNDAAIINNWKMNYPTEIEHMWIASEGELLPSKEAELREKQLLKNNLYESIGTPISLFWDNTVPDGVNYEVNPKAYQIYDDNFQDKESLEGGVIMYEQPFRINGKIPIDAHIITHDPYVSDAWDEGGSLGVTHVWINPKYIPYGAKGNCLAATYIGKSRNGLDGYNNELEKLVAFYGNPLRQLWYEANRGDRLRSHFIKKNKAYLLCLQPQFEQGQHIYLKNTTKTGFIVGSQLSKITMLDRLADWLLEETEIDGEVEKNIFRIPCIFTIRQIKDYSLKGNFDAVSSVMGLPLALGEIEHKILEQAEQRKNPFSGMTKFLKQRTGV